MLAQSGNRRGAGFEEVMVAIRTHIPRAVYSDICARALTEVPIVANRATNGKPFVRIARREREPEAYNFPICRKHSAPVRCVGRGSCPPCPIRTRRHAPRGSHWKRQDGWNNSVPV